MQIIKKNGSYYQINFYCSNSSEAPSSLLITPLPKRRSTTHPWSATTANTTSSWSTSPTFLSFRSAPSTICRISKVTKKKKPYFVWYLTAFYDINIKSGAFGLPPLKFSLSFEKQKKRDLWSISNSENTDFMAREIKREVVNWRTEKWAFYTGITILFLANVPLFICEASRLYSQ